MKKSSEKFEIADTPLYVIESASLIGGLMEKVNLRIRQGYTPLGAPVVWKRWVCQALTKPNYR